MTTQAESRAHLAEIIGNKKPRGRKPMKIDASDEVLIAQLSPDHQAILHQEGQMQEISERLGMPIGTVKSRLSRARAALSALKATTAGN